MNNTRTTNAHRLVSINCKNLKENFLCVNSLIENNELVFLQEHWLNEQQINTLDEIIEFNNHNAYFDTPIDLTQQKKGRPFGGIGWLISKKIKIIEIRFLTNRISLIKRSQIST